jgi:hypothetical protein
LLDALRHGVIDHLITKGTVRNLFASIVIAFMHAAKAFEMEPWDMEMLSRSPIGCFRDRLLALAYNSGEMSKKI